MRKIILATHGELAKGMLDSISMIAGDLTKDIEVYCLYPGQSPYDYIQKMKETVASDQLSEYVFLCDIKGGSVHTALCQLCVYPNVNIFSGMNMNLVLDIVLSDPNNMDELSKTALVNHAREGITFTTEQHLVIEEDEDF